MFEREALRDGLPPRGGRRAGALVVPRRPAGGRRARVRRGLSQAAAARITSAAGPGGGASFGHRSHIRPSWRIRPASRPGVVAEAPEEIRAHGAADRAAGVLRQHQPLERPSSTAATSSRGTPARRAASSADRRRSRARAASGTPSVPIGPSIAASSDPGASGGDFAKEDVARIFVEQRRQLRRDCARPHALMPCIDARSSGRSRRGRSARARSSGTDARSGRRSRRASRCRRRARRVPSPGSAGRTPRPDRRRRRAPCRRAARLPASMSARDQYGTTRLPSTRPRSRLSLSSGIELGEIDRQEIVRRRVERRPRNRAVRARGFRSSSGS